MNDTAARTGRANGGLGATSREREASHGEQHRRFEGSDRVGRGRTFRASLRAPAPRRCSSRDLNAPDMVGCGRECVLLLSLFAPAAFVVRARDG